VNGQQRRRQGHRGRIKNVVVVMTDSLRPDYVAGYRRGTDTADRPGQLVSPQGIGARTPHFDAFAAEAAVFERAYASSFPTVPNRNDLHTGRYTFPQRGWTPLPLDVPCLAATLAGAGIATQLFCDTPNQVPNHLHRGFAGWEWHRGQESDRYVTDHRLQVTLPCAPEKLRNDGATLLQYLRNTHWWRSEEDHFAPRTFRSGINWLQEHYEAGRDVPFLLWLDTFDPHEPWDAPRYYVDHYDPGYAGEVLAHANYGRADYMTPAERQHTKAIYAAEIMMVDRWFGRLLDQIALLGYGDDTAVIHLSDHGHYFGDHGLQGKPFADLFWLYEGLIRTALAVRLPPGDGRPSGGRRVQALAQPQDVTATVLDLFGQSMPGVLGRSLVPAIEDGAGVRELAFTSRFPLVGDRFTPTTITASEWSYQYWPGSPEDERLYHLTDDPGQQRDLRAERPEIARELRAAYLGWMREQNPDLAALMERVEHDPALRVRAPEFPRIG
jgi:arylsulfatase A-like enzyme